MRASKSSCRRACLNLLDNPSTLSHLLQPSTCLGCKNCKPWPLLLLSTFLGRNQCKRRFLDLFCRFPSHIASTIPRPAPLSLHYMCSLSRQSYVRARQNPSDSSSTSSLPSHLLHPSACLARNQCRHRLLALLCRFPPDTASTTHHPAPWNPHCICSQSRRSFLRARLNPLDSPSTLSLPSHLLHPSTCRCDMYGKRGLLALLCRFPPHIASKILHPAL